MRVLVLSNLYPPDFLGGYELACAQVVDALRGRGHDVRVLTAAPRSPVPDLPHVRRLFKLVDEWTHHGFGSTPLSRRLNEAESRLVSAHNVYVLTSMLEEFPADVVYLCNIVGLGGIGLVACLDFLKVPWVWQLGDCVPSVLCRSGDDPYLPLADEFTRRIRGHYIAVSQRLVEEIEAEGVVLQGRIELLPYWIAGERPVARESFYRGGTLRIMSAGQVSKNKGADILIAAAGRLLAEGVDNFSLDFYGHVTEARFAQQIQQLGLSGRVALKGVRPQAELVRLYGDYDLFAFPTHEREPFGLVPLEAVARGCVPVMTRSCGIAEWLVHGVHCLKADRTAAAFARVLGAVARGEVELAPIARRGAEAAWRDFHLESVLPPIERLLAAAARQYRGGAGSAGEAYRLARLAEQLTRTLIQESLSA